MDPESSTPRRVTKASHLLANEMRLGRMIDAECLTSGIAGPVIVGER